jgi:hypothetical protein
MTTTGVRAALLAMAVALALPAAAVAEEAKPKAKERAEEMAREAEEMAKEAIDQLMGALRLVIDSIPQYEAPEVLENGDIIIRRKHPEDVPPAEKGDPDVDETRT